MNENNGTPTNINPPAPTPSNPEEKNIISPQFSNNQTPSINPPYNQMPYGNNFVYNTGQSIPQPATYAYSNGTIEHTVPAEAKITENIIIKQDRKINFTPSRIINGIVLCTVGIVFLLKYLGILDVGLGINIDFYVILSLFIIVIGLMLMVFNYMEFRLLIWVMGSGSFILFALVGLGIYQSFSLPTLINKIQDITIPQQEKNKNQSITFDTKFGFAQNKGTTNDILNGTLMGSRALSITTGDNTINLSESMNWSILDKLFNNIEFQLNPKNFYDLITFKGVYMNYILDFGNINYKTLVFQNIYGTINLIPNGDIPQSTIMVKGAIINANFIFPKDLGVDITIKNYGGGVDLKDFKEIEPGHYQSLGFEKKKNRTTIIIETLQANIKSN